MHNSWWAREITERFKSAEKCLIGSRLFIVAYYSHTISSPDRFKGSDQCLKIEWLKCMKEGWKSY